MASGKTYTEKIKELFEGIHGDVAALLDLARQVRRFPKVGLQKFLKKKKVEAMLPAEVPEEVTNLLRSTEKLDLVPSELIWNFLVEYDE